jgi:hypothetical protein
MTGRSITIVSRMASVSQFLWMLSPTDDNLTNGDAMYVLGRISFVPSF